MKQKSNKHKQTCVQMSCISSGVSTKSTSDLGYGRSTVLPFDPRLTSPCWKKLTNCTKAPLFQLFQEFKRSHKRQCWCLVHGKKKRKTPHDTRYQGIREGWQNPIPSAPFFYNIHLHLWLKFDGKLQAHIFQSHARRIREDINTTILPRKKCSMHGHTKIHKNTRTYPHS